MALATLCQLASEAGGVPPASALRELLRDEPELMQSLCNVYIQDFLCLGYPLPEGCELLPRHAARAPSTAGITPGGSAALRSGSRVPTAL